MKCCDYHKTAKHFSPSKFLIFQDVYYDHSVCVLVTFDHHTNHKVCVLVTVDHHTDHSDC